MSNRAWSKADGRPNGLATMIGFVLVGLTTATAQAQTVDAALRDRVTQLIDRLGAEDAAARDAAEAALIKLGARALPLLPDASAVPGEERKKRLQAIKTALHAYGTNIEGEWDSIFDAIEKCHQVVHEMGAPRIFTTLKVGTRIDREQSMEDKIRSVEQKLGS